LLYGLELVMEDNPVDRLQKRKLELTQELAETAREARKARQQKKDKKKSEANAWNLSDLLVHAALIIYSLCGYMPEPCVVFLRACGRRRHWPEKSEDELQAIVENAFLAFNFDELASLVDVDHPADVSAMKAALPYVEQWRLVVWTRSLNARQGVPPSTESVLHRLEELRREFPEGVRPQPVGSAAEARARVWAGAWRRRFGGRHGRIPIRDDISQADLRRKVLAETLINCIFL
jgi:hypothetical protein